ncbi:sensor histidine kinase [Caproicibacter fermentans]|uniref:sensor histidine kinase n=1 Tax=Caproicibacter fermentans TaxID=2576756 RepID=UPI0014131486|nr:sensor histidine kinase [Caproicibacter fermentans]
MILLYAGLDALISIIISLITGSSIPLYDKDPILLFLDVFLLQIIMLLFYKFIVILLKKQENYFVYMRQFAILVLFLIINVVVIYFLTLMAANSELDQKSIHYIMMLMTLLSSILNLSVIYFFEFISKSTLLQKRIELMQQKVDMQYNYYQQLEIEYNKSQKIMHDVKNHIEIINQLYQSKHFDKGLEYTSKLNSIIDELGLKFNCNNKILNIIVNENIKKCELNEIKFSYSVENLDLSFIDDMDITAIFANLFDNAVEACQKVNENDRKIELRLYKFNNMLIVNLLNSYADPIIKRNERFLSNKMGHKAIGLSNVKQAIDKYDGDINIDIDQNKFSVSIMFPIQN